MNNEGQVVANGQPPAAWGGAGAGNNNATQSVMNWFMSGMGGMMDGGGGGMGMMGMMGGKKGKKGMMGIRQIF